MRKKQNHNKNFVPLIFCSVLVLQQAVCNASFASTITDASGNAIAKDPTVSDMVGKNVFNLRPEAFNGKVGFRQFKDLNITDGDVVNFLYQALQLDVVDGVHQHKYFDIDTFVNLVQNGVTINGIVNTMYQRGDTSMNAGNLVFISPNGIMVGSTGVLNVGSLQVYTPSGTEFNNMRAGLPDREKNTTFSDGSTWALAQNVTNTFDPSNPALYTGSGAITINGRVAARNNIELNGGQINVGNGGLLLAGIGKDKTYITTNNAADTLFNSLVNADNMNSANAFSSADGKIVIQSNVGTDIANGAKVRNYNTALDSSLTIKNTGANGIKIAGEVSNPDGTMTITNSAGALSEASTGLIKNKGTLNITNNGSGTGIALDGTITNDGNMTVLNETGANGLSVGGNVTNDTGTATFTNKVGGLTVANGGVVTSNGTNLDITNSGAKGLKISGTVDNNNGTVTVTNTSNKLMVDSTGKILNSGSTMNIINRGVNSLEIAGEVLNEAGAGAATITNTADSTSGGLNVSGLVKNNGAGLTVNNSGAGGLNVESKGRIENYSGALDVNNYTGALNVKRNSETSYGVIKNAGNRLNITNSGAVGLNIDGLVENTNGTAEITNTNGGLLVSGTGKVTASGNSLKMNNSGSGGLNIDGLVENTKGTADIQNTNAGLNVSSTGKVSSSGTRLTVQNTGADGMDIQGLVKHNNTAGVVNFINKNSDMTVGHRSTEFNIDSNADVNITVTNGNLLNNGVAKTLIRTTKGADLITNVTNGSVGLEIGPCDGGVCTGVGPAERDLTKSINTDIDGTITIDNTGTGALVNLASLNKDMHINRIHSDGRVILLADDKTNKGTTPYSILNKSADNSATPNIKGKGISAIASGNIGANTSDKITFLQTGTTVDIANEHDDASQPHDLYDVPRVTSQGGVEFLAIGDINAKGLDNADGTKADTNVCTISSREGSVNVEFSGNTYIRDITAQDEINIVDRGSEMYIQNLGGAPSRYKTTGDYYGDYTNIVPEKANIKVLDMGTADDPNLVPNSTLVIKNGTVNGQGSTSHPGLDQDITVTADNAYVGGYYFNMGKHRMPGLSQVTPDDRTNPIVNANPDTDKPASIRGKAVRPDDVTATGEPDSVRDYYYGYDPDKGETPDDAGPDGTVSGSGQRDDETFDPTKEKADDLVVPEPDDPTPPTPGDDDDDDGPTPPTPGDDDDDDDDGPTPPTPGDDDDDDGPTPPTPGDDDDDDGPTPPPPGDDDDGPTPPKPQEPEDLKPFDPMKQTWKKEYTDYIEVIDKRQYMRFDTDAATKPVVFNSDSQASGILNISRGGVQLSHNKSLKVGDVVPVHIKYGDVEVNTEVKVVSTTDKTAGAEFVDLDLATKNKILYLSLLKEQGDLNGDQFYADVLPKSDSLSTTGVDD